MIASVLGYMVLVMTYSLMAVLTIEMLLSLWQVKDPPLDIAFRLMVLAIPPGAPLLFAMVSPGDAAGELRRMDAFLDLRNWLGQEPSLAHPGWVLLVAVMAAASLLEAAALVRWLWAGRSRQTEWMAELSGRLEEICARMTKRGAKLPLVRVAAHPGPVAYTVGLIRPAILVSPALVDLLDDEELEAVLAHEASHAERQDNWLGWLTFVLRCVSFYNPVAHFTYHRMGHDVEKVCDARAAEMTGKGLALASALIKVYMATRRPLPGRDGLASTLEVRAVALENRARRSLVEDRADRLLHPEAVRPTSFSSLRLALAGLSVLGLMYVVV